MYTARCMKDITSLRVKPEHSGPNVRSLDSSTFIRVMSECDPLRSVNIYVAS